VHRHGLDRDVHELVVDKTDNHLRLSSHCGVNGVVAETFAVDGIVRSGDGCADLITRIYVFKIDMEMLVFEILRDFIAEINTDVGELDIA
jgi:uncharacterized protein YuzB (UPF0349 family)